MASGQAVHFRPRSEILLDYFLGGMKMRRLTSRRG
jgi:hypothetical protein